MSLNRSEQLVFDYLQTHPEERQHWREKVLAVERREPDPHAAAASLERELWRYYQERSQVAPAFRGHGLSETTQRVSLRNLAEYLLRLWVPLRPKRRLTPGDNGASGPEKT
jgi:hypothetical protein